DDASLCSFNFFFFIDRFVFFSSRRRHTRFSRDWSSDVCSSDLGVTGSGKTYVMANVIAAVQRPTLILAHNKTLAAQLYGEMRERSEERRVGKECRSRWWAEQ